MLVASKLFTPKNIPIVNKRTLMYSVRYTKKSMMVAANMQMKKTSSAPVKTNEKLTERKLNKVATWTTEDDEEDD